MREQTYNAQSCAKRFYQGDRRLLQPYQVVLYVQLIQDVTWLVGVIEELVNLAEPF